ncbi:MULTISPECIES: hypothetical protein [Nocardiopsis]|nr:MULTISPECIES: hypothetical protein [Nocardiopsis]PWV55266.1 hypothetical protein BDW27_103270 [Nocardiopsis sp. L17-MgMaSL7]
MSRRPLDGVTVIGPKRAVTAFFAADQSGDEIQRDVVVRRL